MSGTTLLSPTYHAPRHPIPAPWVLLREGVGQHVF